MLSKSIVESISLTIRLGFKTGAFPYEWDSKELQLKLTQSKVKLFQWYLTVVYIFTNTVFMSVRFVQGACCMNLSYGKLFMNMFNVVTWTTSCAFELNTLLRTEQILEFVNQMMRSSKLFDGKSTNPEYGLWMRV